MSAPRGDSDHCKVCGSDDLFSGFYDADDLAVSDDSAPGTRWTTFCNQCGHDQAKPRPRRERKTA